MKHVLLVNLKDYDKGTAFTDEELEAYFGEHFMGSRAWQTMFKKFSNDAEFYDTILGYDIYDKGEYLSLSDCGGYEIPLTKSLLTNIKKLAYNLEPDDHDYLRPSEMRGIYKLIRPWMGMDMGTEISISEFSDGRGGRREITISTPSNTTGLGATYRSSIDVKYTSLEAMHDDIYYATGISIRCVRVETSQGQIAIHNMAKTMHFGCHSYNTSFIIKAVTKLLKYYNN